MSFSTGRIARFSSRQIIAVVIIFTIAALLVPLPVATAALRTADSSVREAKNKLSTWLASEVATLKSGTTQADNRERKGVRPSPPMTREERAMKVARLELNVAGEIELKSRQPMLISAIPVDAEGNAIQGLIATWQSTDKEVVFVRKNGEVLAGNVGKATLIATAGNKHETVRVRVVESSKEPFGGKKRVDSKRTSQGEALGAVIRKTSNLVAKNRNSHERAHATSKLPTAASMLPFMRDPNDDPLPDNETGSLYQTNNLIGAPPGKKKPGALSAASAVSVTESGTKNFKFGLPIVNLPGRGLSVSLNLFYNSLLWNKSTNPSTGATWMTYDVDSGYPAQGFRLGYGQIEDQGSAGFTLTDSDGTRHALVYSSWSHYDTTDGTFIHFNGGSGWGTLYYPDGMQVAYGAAGGGQRSYPTSVMDRNGNYILISYVNGVGPRISTIQDTLGRYVRFYYDSNNDLVTITTPGLTGQSDLQVMRFYYETLTLSSGLFASGINVSQPSAARVIRYIYLPASAEGGSSGSGDIGYRFDYSSYGMIYQMVKFHGMTASTTSTSSTGTVNQGTNTTAATTTYDYDISPSGISDVPAFSRRTDEWAGRTSGVSAPYYTFSVSEQTSETISTVTAPGGATVTETHAIKNPGVWNDGLVTETQVQNSSSVVIRKIVRGWEQNSSNGTPRVASVRLTNESGKTTAKVFSYDDAHTPYK